MPEINVKSFNQTVETMENMIQGVKTLKTIQGFPPVITEEVLNDMLVRFKTKRDIYEQASFSTAQYYEDYSSTAKEINGELARFKTMLYGFFGKKNPIVNNFGIRPHKAKPKAQKTTPTAPVTKVA